MHWMLCLSRLSILLSKHIHTFLAITFLIFNRFSIRKSFRKLRLRAFHHTINTIYVDTVDTRQVSLMHSMLFMSTLLIQTHPHIPAHNFLNIQLIFNPQKVFRKLRLRAFQQYHQYYICRYCWYKTRISNAFNAIYVNTVNTVFTPHYSVYSVVQKPQTPVSTVSTNRAFNALHALMFIATVSTNNITYTIHNSIALILCIDCLNMPFNVHSTTM